MTAQRQTEALHATDPRALEQALRVIERGGPVVIPTETVYGLTADAENAEAVQKVFDLKGRSLEKPSAIYLPTADDIETYAVDLPTVARRVIAELLPGPLTVVLKSRRHNWPGVVGADGRIGFRVSSDRFVAKLTIRSGRPLLATSASLSGGGDLVTYSEVMECFGNRVPLILYKEERLAGRASTVLDLSTAKPHILRQGDLQLPDWVFA